MIGLLQYSQEQLLRIRHGIRLSARWASSFSGDHQHNLQCPSCYIVTIYAILHCLYSVGNNITTNRNRNPEGVAMGSKMNFDILSSHRACFRNRLVPRHVYSLYLSICILINSVVKNAAHCFLLSNLQMFLLLKRWSFVSLAALEVIILTNCHVTSDDNFVNLTTLPLQCLFVSLLIYELFLFHLHLILPTMKWLKDHVPLERYFSVVCTVD